MREALVSVVCVSHGRRELLAECLASCFAQDWKALEVVVMLNPSDPEAEAEIRGRFAAVRLFRTHRNLGFFPVLNLAIANSNGEYIMTVDDDARFLESGAIRGLVGAFEKEPWLGAVTCNLVGPRETTIDGPDRYIREFTTGFTLVPRRAFTEWIGFYPDLFFRAAGEGYMCAGLWELGRPVKKMTGVRMHHELASTGRSNRDWHFHGLRSQVLCALMRVPALLLVPVLLSKLLRSLILFVGRGMPGIWVHAVCSTAIHAYSAWAMRRPVRMATWRMMHFLGRRVVTDFGELKRRFGFRPVDGR